jgi:hypothetical protein
LVISRNIRAIGIEGSQPRAPNGVALTARIVLNFGAQDQQDGLVDTARIGDGNGGHIWRTDLAEPNRMALLEYLKAC